DDFAGPGGQRRSRCRVRPIELVPGSDQYPCDEIADLAGTGAGARTALTEGQTVVLKQMRRMAAALGRQFQGIGRQATCLLLEEFEPIVDGTDRRNQVVA